MTQTLRVAVCLYPGVTTLDYQGPVELLGMLSAKNREHAALATAGIHIPDVTIEFTYLSHTLEPVEPIAGPPVVPSLTYENAKEQFDIVLIPGGMYNAASRGACAEFIKKQAAGAKHILSVCTGSLILARTGLLSGKRATTNKFAFRMVQEETKDLGVIWVPKARWVVTEDKKIWTASGITAGADMAGGFLDYLIGKDGGYRLRSFIELSMKTEEDDEFAAYHGLV
ncbi:DJ-1 protein-PfpI domain-containing protein [Favolaschia claudopus]|uniref:DJ-1 protein-PfpI domain-containing protein n=1 Tax=Favolaschia claudopus TaxID=2862362 RepID=A0AAW0BGY6_9AGAR